MDKALNEGQVLLWPDDETKAFYTNLLDIRAIVPKTLYKVVYLNQIYMFSGIRAENT